MLMVPVHPVHSQRRRKFPNRRTDVLTDDRFDVFVDSIPEQQDEVRFQGIDVVDEFSKPFLSYDGSEVDVGRGHDMDIATLPGSFWKYVFQFSYDGMVGILPAARRKNKARHAEYEPDGNMVPRMEEIEVGIEKMSYVKRRLYGEYSQKQIGEHRQPKRSDPQEKGDEPVFEIPLCDASDQKHGGHNAESDGINGLKY